MDRPAPGTTGRGAAERERLAALRAEQEAREALVSAAQRTLETWEHLDIAGDTPMKALPELYDGVPSTYLKSLPNLDCDSVLMIGHNPTIASLMDHFLRDAEMPVELTAVPTGATAALTFEAEDWEEVIRGTGTLKAWVIPRSLTEG